MKEKIHSLISMLERDPASEEAASGLEELVTGDLATTHGAELAAELMANRKALMEAQRFEAACKLIEMELALVRDPAAEAELLVEQGRILDDELFDQKAALEKYKKALSLRSGDEELERKIRIIEDESAKWKESVDTFKEQAEAATDAALKGHMYYGAAVRTYKNHRRGKDIPALLESALAADPSHVKAARLLEKTLRERERWQDLAELYAKLAEYRRSKEERAQMLLAAAHVYATKLEDKEAAAIQYSEVMDLVPGNEVAMRFLVKYYEDQEDWDHVVAVYEDALAGKLSREDETAMLMQVGMIHWRMRKNLDAAEEYFRRLRKLDPAHPAMMNFYRAYAAEKGDSGKLYQILSDAQRVTRDKALSEQLTKEVAQLAAGEGGNAERAIDAFKQVLRDEPGNTEALSELKRLYRDGEKWNALLDLLKNEANGLPEGDAAGRVALYEEMAAIYRDRLSLGTMVINTYKLILDLDPANAAAQEALAVTYEAEGRWNDLINVLGKRAQVVSDPAEKIAVLNRIAGLWVERFNNFNRAVGPLEEILALDPGNSKAIETLRGVYEKRRAWRPLLELFEKEVAFLGGEAKVKRLTEMADLASERLSDHARAIEIWREVLAVEPANADALSALERLTERAKDWAGLADVLERRIAGTADADERVELLTKLGTVHKDRLHEPARAADAWKRVLELKPGHAKAMRALKEAYSAAEDWASLERLYTEANDHEGLVEVLGIAADRVSDAETKKRLSFRCAEIYDEQIGQPDRAVRHYERVLTVDSGNERAARALAPIYRRGEKWNRLLGVLEAVLGHTQDAAERVRLMEEMRELSADRMNNRGQAFDWAARAFAENPRDGGVRATLESAAEAASKFEELVALYRAHLEKFEGEERKELERHIADLALDRLGAVDDAVAGYRAILAENPADEAALAALENIFRGAARWEELIDVFERRIALSADIAAKRALMIEAARLFEEGMDDPERAEGRYRAVLEICPDDREALVALERITRLCGRWEALADILGKRRDLVGVEEGEWRDLTIQLGELMSGELKDKERAILIYNELLERQPGDEGAVSAMEQFLRDESLRAEVARILEPHLVLKENWPRLSWVLAILIESTADGTARLDLQNRLADVYAEKLGDGRLAFETLGAALREHPAETALWERMTAMAGPLGLAGELADRLADAYRSKKLGAETEVELAGRLADLFDTELGRPADAAIYHARVFGADPTKERAFLALEGLYTRDERWDELLEIYRRALDAGCTAYTPLDLQLKVCFILEEVKQDVQGAIASYRAVLELDPSNQQAVRALTALYEQAERWQDLSELLAEQLDAAKDEEARGLRYRLGEIAEHHLAQPAEALEYYELVLIEDPDHLKAEEALERLLEVPELRLRAARVLAETYGHQGAAEPLARVLMIEFEDDNLDVLEQVEILKRVADLRERRLGDREGAFAVLAEALTKEPSNDGVRAELARLARENGINDRYAAVLDGVIPKVADDVPLASTLIAETARIYEEQLGDLERAEKAYRRLLELNGDNPAIALPAVEALERIFAGGEAWEDLLDVLRVKVRLTDDLPTRVQILHRMAEIEESVLERVPRAVEVFREILDYEESDMNALFGLERLYEREGRFRDLIDVLRRRAAIETSAELRRDLLLRVGALFEEKLSEPDEAIAAYNQVNDEVGASKEALDALGRLYQQTGRFRDLFDVYQAKEQLAGTREERAELLFKMGDLLRTKLDEPDKAVSLLGESLAIEPGHKSARASLEALLESSVRREAIAILRPVFELEANHDKLIRCDEIEAEETEDAEHRSALFCHAAEVAELGMADPRRAFDYLSRAFRDGTASPELARIIDGLERLGAGLGAHAELTALYRAAAPDILDGEQQVRCNLRVADIAATVLGDAETAREYYVKVLDIDGENAAAMDALERIYEGTDQHLELFEILRRKVRSAKDEDARQAILFKQARVCEENLEDISGATTTYEAILEADPENGRAIAALERLFPKAERWADLMDLLERRAKREPDERNDLLHRLGTLAADKLGDDERALDYFARVLSHDPGHAKTLAALEAALSDEAKRGRVAEILEPVYKGRGDWVKLASALEARLEFCDDPAQRKELLRQVGRLHEEQLGDLDKAFDTFARLFREDVEDRSSWDLLTRLASVLEAWDRLAEVFASALEDVVGDTPVTAELAYNLGEIYEQRLHQPAEATKAYRRTLSFAPDDPKAFAAVERMLLSTERWSELLELYRDAADASLDVSRRKDFIFKIAEIHEGPNGDKDAAIEAYRDVLGIDERDQRAITTLDRLYFQTGRFDDLASHLRAQIDQGEDPRARNELRCRLARVYEENAADHSAAVDVYEEAIREEGGGIAAPVAALEKLIMQEDQRERIACILEPIYRETDEWKKLIVILQTEIPFIENAAEKAGKWKEIAALHAARGANYLLSFEALSKAFGVDPTDRQTLGELVKLAEQTGSFDELARVLGASIEEIYDLELKADVLHLLGTTFDRRLDMPRKAIEAFRKVLEINENDPEALDALEGLYNLVGDWDGLVQVLAMKAAAASSPADRAELLRTKASIHEDLMSSPKDAIEAYREALDADPASLVTLDALERLYGASAAWTDLIEIKRQRVEALPSDEERVVVLRSIAEVYEERIKDAADAISAWRNVLDQDGRDPAAVVALDRLYAKEGMFPELLENLRMQKEMTSDQALSVDISFRIGSLQEKDLMDLEGAIESYRDVLAEQPTHAGAITALERLAEDEAVRSRAVEVLEPLHREAARWDRLAHVLELKIAVAADAPARLNELLALAEIHASGRSDPNAAFDAYARALAEDPSRVDVMEALERIAGIERLFGKLADVYAAQADKVYEPENEWAILIRLGEVREAELGDAAAAIAAYRRALDGGCADPRVLSALDRLYLRTSMWTELDEILEREIDVAEDADQANALKLRQGSIREREFGDIAGAITAYKDVLERSPENDEAIAALEALLVKDEFVGDIVPVLTPAYEARGAREKVSDLFGHRLRVAGDDAERVRLFRELAEHQENVIGDLSATFEAYAKAFALEPLDQGLLDQLERLADVLGAWAAAVEVAERVLAGDILDAPAAVDLGLRVARWAANNVGDPHKAEALYRAVLEKEPDHRDALSALEDLLRNLGRFEDLLPVMQRRAETAFDFGEKKRLYLAIAQIARFELGNLAEAMAAYKAVRELDEADLDALDALVALTEEQSDFSALVELLLARATFTTEVAASNSYRHRAAAILIGPLQSPARAVDVFKEVLDGNPDDRDAAAQLDGLFGSLARWDDLKDLLTSQLDTAADAAERVSLLKRLAELGEQRFDNLDEAISNLNEVLLSAPDDEEAVMRLKGLYAKAERWTDLVELLEGRADRARDMGEAAAELSLLVQVGEIWDQRLADSDRATAIYERVLERDPEHTRALAALARLYEANEDWERCAEVLHKAAATGRGGPDEAEVHFRLARLYAGQMRDAERAAAELERAVALDPGHAEANKALADHCREKGDDRGLLAALLREERALTDPAAKVAKLLEMAELNATALKDEAGAVAALEKALTLVPDNKDVLLRLADAYVAAGRQNDAIPVIESLIAAETEGGKKRTKKAAVYHQRLAIAYLGRGDDDKALANLEAAYKLDVANIEVLVSLGKLHYDRGELDQAVKLFRALLLQRFEPTLGLSKADIYWYVGDISIKQGDPRKAKGMFQRGLDENPSHAGCKAGLAACP